MGWDAGAGQLRPLPLSGRLVPHQVNLTSENPVTLSAGTQLDFTYSVEWSATSTSFHRRFDRYLDYDFFEHQVGVPTERSTAPGQRPVAHSSGPALLRRTDPLVLDLQLVHDGARAGRKNRAPPQAPRRLS